MKRARENAKRVATDRPKGSTDQKGQADLVGFDADTAAVLASVPAVKAPAPVTVPDNRDYRSRYLDGVAPASVVGRMIKFTKDGKFITTDDDQEVPQQRSLLRCVPRR